jgi:hypothetical protein
MIDSMLVETIAMYERLLFTVDGSTISRCPRCCGETMARPQGVRNVSKRVLQVLAMLFSIVAATLIVASPASANKTGCGSTACFTAEGSGLHVTPRVCMYTKTGTSVTGHMQIRWHHNGVDSTQNSNASVIRPTSTCMNVNFLVDNNTLVCGRWWHWTGSSWVLSFGDYKCARAPL